MQEISSERSLMVSECANKLLNELIEELSPPEILLTLAAVSAYVIVHSEPLPGNDTNDVFSFFVEETKKCFVNTLATRG